MINELKEINEPSFSFHDSCRCYLYSNAIIKLFLGDLEYCLETDITIIDRKIDIQVCSNQIYIKPYKNFKKKKNGHHHFLRTKVTSHQPKVIIFFSNLKYCCMLKILWRQIEG